MSRFLIEMTPLDGLMFAERKPMGDHRGSLTRLFCSEDLKAIGWTVPIVQINHTRTGSAGTVRGLHFQHTPHCEKKLVSCIRGAIFDVAVDVREGSKTYLQWYGRVLSADNNGALLVPEGFAHGFQTLEDDTEVVYCVSAPYVPDAEGGIRPLDNTIGVEWPAEIRDLSDRDRNHPLVADGFIGVSL